MIHGYCAYLELPPLVVPLSIRDSNRNLKSKLFFYKTINYTSWFGTWPNRMEDRSYNE